MMSLLFFAKLTAVLLLGAGAVFLSRKLPASSRHLLCIAAVSMAVGLPLTLELPSFAQPQIIAAAAAAPGNMVALSHSSVPVLAVVWLAGTVFILLRFLFGTLYFARRIRNAAQPSHSSRSELPILFTDVKTPVLWGWCQPKILMPLAARDWSAERQQIAIAHELAHYHRRDNWTALISIAAQSMYWFHPLVWWLTLRAEQQRELACDDRVLVRGASPSEYAALLVDIARQHSSPVSLGCAMVHNTNRLKGRLMHILYFRNSHSCRRNRFVVASAISVMFLGCLLIPASASQKKIYKIGGDVSSPSVLYKTEPEYSPESKRDKVQGSVLLHVVINAHGRVQNIHVARSLNAGLDENAMKAVTKWRFQPAMKNGKPVSVEANIQINFRLL